MAFLFYHFFVYQSLSLTQLNKKIFVILIIIIAIVVIVLFGVKKYNDEKEELANFDYKLNLESIIYKMLDGSVEAEDCGNLIKSVWYNTIWEESDVETDKYTKRNGVFNEDFNDSLDLLFNDNEFKEKIYSIEQNQEEVESLFKKLKNPSENWEEAYLDLKEYYDDYLTFTNLCINPSGNLQTYSTNFNETDSDVSNDYDKMKAYLDY